jgi:hypothetical protein
MNETSAMSSRRIFRFVISVLLFLAFVALAALWAVSDRWRGSIWAKVLSLAWTAVAFFGLFDFLFWGLVFEPRNTKSFEHFGKMNVSDKKWRPLHQPLQQVDQQAHGQQRGQDVNDG